MSEWNTIYDLDRRIVGSFRFGVAWARNPRQRLGDYDDGAEGQVRDDAGRSVARFRDGQVHALDGSPIGCFDEVPFEEFSGDQAAELQGALIKRLVVNGHPVGWCIGKPEAACAAIVLMFASEGS